MLEFIALAQHIQQCVPTTLQERMAAIVKVESNQNPFAIGVVGGRLVRQPKNLDEAVSTAKALHDNGWNFSLGPAQINYRNLQKFDLNYETAFDSCKNLTAGAKILTECDNQARNNLSGDDARNAAYSCYYSGNLKRGFIPDSNGTSYVQRVVLAENEPVKAIPIRVIPNRQSQKKSIEQEKKPLQPAEKQPTEATPEQPKSKTWDIFNDFTTKREK